MRTALTLAGFLAIGQAAAALPATFHAGEIVQVNIAQLHPTQAAIGYRQLDYSLQRYKAKPKKLFDDYCESMGQKGVEDFTAHSSLTHPASFRCKAAVGSVPEKMKTAVIGPDAVLYLTDGHHTFSSFIDVAGTEIPVQVRITDDFRSLKTLPAFWQKMAAAHLVWLDSPTGPVQPDALPTTLGRAHMQNDEYRSLVYFARNVGYAKGRPAPPFLEFYWGKWLETQLPLKNFNLNDAHGYADAVAAAAQKITAVPKETVIAHSDSGPLTAAELGALDAVNEKALRKLRSGSGKLALAFAQ